MQMCAIWHKEWERGKRKKKYKYSKWYNIIERDKKKWMLRCLIYKNDSVMFGKFFNVF